MMNNASIYKYPEIKCGEIYHCKINSTYNVTCNLCITTVPFEKFIRHFKEHLAQLKLIENDKESDLKCNKKSGISKDVVKPNTYDPTVLTKKLYTIESTGQDDDEPLVDLVDLQMEYVDLSDDDDVQIVVMEDNSISKSQTIDKLVQEVEPKPADKTEEKGKPEPDVEQEPESVDKNEDRDWQNEQSEDTSSEDYFQEEPGLPFPCSICSRFFKSKSNLQCHFTIMHNPDRKPKPKVRRLPKEKHKCEECGEEFTCARLLRGHKWKHTGIICDVCGKTFTQTGNMLRHKKRHTGVKPHKCKVCDNSFFTTQELRAHMLRHTEARPVICEICGKPCRDRGVLTAHMRRHTGERPAKCEVCEKRFYSFHDLNVHAVTHTSERPFACDICGATFQRKKAVRVHKKLHNKKRSYECKICKKLFNKPTELKSHMRTHVTASGEGKLLLVAATATLKDLKDVMAKPKSS